MMFEQIRQRLTGESKKREPVTVVPAQPEDVRQLNIGWNSQFNTPGLRQHIQQQPGLVWRVRGQGDYIVGDYWRRREEIGQILESHTRYYRGELVNGLLSEYRRRNFAAIIVSPNEWDENYKLYSSLGFGELERVVYYEKPNVDLNYQHHGAAIDLRRYTGDPTMLRELVAVDHAAFPWLWWNSLVELEYYRVHEDVNVQIGYIANQPVGYFGFTLYDNWAHLDRLAVVPGMHGRGIGAFLLATAINIMARGGAKRVTLSTQLTNEKSQRLYEGFGFDRVPSLEYSLTGIWLTSHEPRATSHEP
jgi:ribosomal protein S18 acetylase RimI-like enzyme